MIKFLRVKRYIFMLILVPSSISSGKIMVEKYREGNDGPIAPQTCQCYRMWSLGACCSTCSRSWVFGAYWQCSGADRFDQRGFHDPLYDHSSQPASDVGKMNHVCRFCRACKFAKEALANGTVDLPVLLPPPEPLSSSVAGVSSDSKHALNKTRKYNSCFQLRSFNATRIIRNNYTPAFKVQAQVHHQICSLLPESDNEPTFL